MGILFGNDTHRPAVTLPQLIAAVPLVANLLAAWGVFTPTAAQQSTLTDLLAWAFALIAGDAVIRVGRNIGDGLKKRPMPVTLTGSTGASGFVPPAFTGGAGGSDAPKGGAGSGGGA